VVGKDRAALVFHEWSERIKSKTAWHTPLAFVVSLAATFVTASFKDFDWIKGATLKGVFIATLLACCVWLISEVRRASKSRGSTTDFIARLSEGTKKTEYPNETDARSPL
jgi:FtsH-binding integral membrane protein